MPPAIAGTLKESLSWLLITTRALGNNALSALTGMLRKYFSSTEPGTILPRASLRSSPGEAISSGVFIATIRTTSS